MLKIEFKNTLFNFCKRYPIESEKVSLDNTYIKINGHEVPLILLRGISIDAVSNVDSVVTFKYLVKKDSEFNYSKNESLTSKNESLTIAGNDMPFINDPKANVTISDYGNNGAKQIEVSYEVSIINSINSVDF